MRQWVWLFVGCCAFPAARATSEPIEVRATAVPLDPRAAGARHVGRLTYRGGLHLTSPAPVFGGLSALHVSSDGAALVAVSDKGAWLSARLVYDGAGELAGVAQAEMGPLRDTHGAPLQGKSEQDAEGLARLPDSAWVVSFERRHRLWRYAAARAPEGAAEELTVPAELAHAPANGGLEALTVLHDGRLVAICEELRGAAGVRGFVREGQRWHPLTYASDGPLAPSAATTLPSGDLLVLERGYSEQTGVRVRLQRVAAPQVRANARLAGELLASLEPPLSVDNFEGLAARRASSGETLIYLLSDDNFSASQRTLLMMFALDDARPAR